MKLRALVKAFDIPPSAIADICGVSRAYITRLTQVESDSFAGSPQFWATLERELGRIIAARKGQVFEVDALEGAAITALSNTLVEVA